MTIFCYSNVTNICLRALRISSNPGSTYEHSLAILSDTTTDLSYIAQIRIVCGCSFWVKIKRLLSGLSILQPINPVFTGRLTSVSSTLYTSRLQDICINLERINYKGRSRGGPAPMYGSRVPHISDLAYVDTVRQLYQYDSRTCTTVVGNDFNCLSDSGLQYGIRINRIVQALTVPFYGILKQTFSLNCLRQAVRSSLELNYSSRSGTSSCLACFIFCSHS